MFRRVLLITALLAGAGLSMGFTTPGNQGQSGGATAALQEAGGPLESWMRESIEAVRRGDASLMFESPGLVSVLRREIAHGDDGDTVWLEPVNWDAEAGELVPVQALFGQPEANPEAYAQVSGLLRAAAVDQVWGGNPGTWRAAIEAEIQPAPDYLSTFSFVPSTVPQKIGGLAWHFGPEVIAPAERGVVSVVLPQQSFRQVILPGWRDRFDGAPADAVSARFSAPEGKPL